MKGEMGPFYSDLGILVYPGGDEAQIIRYEDGSLQFVPILKYKRK